MVTKLVLKLDISIGTREVQLEIIFLIEVTNGVLKFDKFKDIKELHLQNILSI